MDKRRRAGTKTDRYLFSQISGISEKYKEQSDNKSSKAD